MIIYWFSIYSMLYDIALTVISRLVKKFRDLPLFLSITFFFLNDDDGDDE